MKFSLMEVKSLILKPFTKLNINIRLKSLLILPNINKSLGKPYEQPFL